ncbi:uncharacterized protein LOC125226665 isoform X2 [Leguminivora glycinivorella]|uniref:uncharacterized protein LOC125226665 isoform X2 n=1 Tax=Leguminivora glycinivorella TaxID=1035111 RepID=UPI00200BEE4C|nr:uncharacterized protein LOC125226665 isoform X2 [Leguminivora glycinivorella]
MEPTFGEETTTQTMRLSLLPVVPQITFSSTWRSKQQVHVNDNLNLLGPAITDKKHATSPRTSPNSPANCGTVPSALLLPCDHQHPLQLCQRPRCVHWRPIPTYFKRSVVTIYITCYITWTYIWAN